MRKKIRLMYSDIQHVFFDLDRTLWDFNANSRATLTELHSNFNLLNKGKVQLHDFISVYERINDELWSLYRHGKIEKSKLRSERFLQAVAHFGMGDSVDMAKEMGDFYVSKSPYKTGVFKHTHSILDKLSKAYTLHIITNGFEEVQHIKLRESKLRSYFNEVITSELAGATKPNKIIFEYAQNVVDAAPNECLIIGDDMEADINGGRAAGWKTILFDPDNKSINSKSISVNCLSQLEKLLLLD